MWTKDNYIEKQLDKFYAIPEKPRERSKLSVSDTGCVLHRQLKLWHVPTDRPLTTHEKMVFDFGSQLHTYLQRVIVGENEFELEDQYFMGHIDKITDEDGLLVVNEFKSIKDYGLDMVLKENSPQEAHIKQATNYVRMLKDMGKPVADYFRIIYLAKCFDDSHRKFLYKNKDVDLAEGRVIIRLIEYQVDYDPILADVIVEEAKVVMENVEKKNPLACSEWERASYHRDSKWNQYISWCSKSPEENKKRLEELNVIRK